MTLDRLGVRGKLNLLLLLPLVAVLVVAVPFVASQIQSAQSAASTAESARQARQLGALVWELQRERQLTAAYLAVPFMDPVPLVLQQRVVDDTVETIRVSLGDNASDELRQALVRLSSVVELRQAVLRRGTSLDSVSRTYHALVFALIDALRLVPQHTSDAEGTRQLSALEAMFRANEHSSLRGMALITAAVDPKIGRAQLEDSGAQARMFTERFVKQANPEQSALVVLSDQGDAARRVEQLAVDVPQGLEGPILAGFIAQALADSEAQASLRRLVQDRVTSDITNTAAERARSAEIAAWTVGLGTALLFTLVMVLSMAVSRSIADPLQRLTRAAAAVADLANTELVRVADTETGEEQQSPPRLAAIEVSTNDELGELAKAFNRVQTTAAQLIERQVVSRRNVSLMFSNVAQRTQNLVNRQLALVDELERNEQDPALLANLYRLDHLSTRLRRNAENLLVIAGTREEARMAAPTQLAMTLRSALAEIEEYQRVRFHAIAEVTIPAALVSDLTLLFAELLENATSFSPPESYVDVYAEVAPDETCRVSIVDHGIGLSLDRLEEENLRLVERERLDIAPTSVLGLFVVGRIARRHGLMVELQPTSGSGVTAHVILPPHAFSAGIAPAPAPARPLTTVNRRPTILPPVPPVPALPAPKNDGFGWFNPPQAVRPAVVEAPAPEVSDYQRVVATATVVLPTIDPVSRGSLKRRVPGAQLPTASLAADTPHAAPAPRHDAVAARDSMDAFQTAVARAATVPTMQADPVTVTAPAPPAEPPPAAPMGRSGLARRVPGASLAPGLLDDPNKDTPKHKWQVRDPEAERSAFDAYSHGLARAAVDNDHDRRK